LQECCIAANVYFVALTRLPTFWLRERVICFGQIEQQLGEGDLEILIETVMAIGLGIQDGLEGKVLALFIVVIILDTYLGLRDKKMWRFNILQVLGLIAGYYWANGVFEQQDVAGPWAWGRVIGIWIISVLLFHAWYAISCLKSRA
jgi:hypothetical protein